MEHTHEIFVVLICSERGREGLQRIKNGAKNEIKL